MIQFAKRIFYQGKFVNDLKHEGTVGNNPPKDQVVYKEIRCEYRQSTKRGKNAKASDYRNIRIIPRISTKE
jgi:hypothetical protein